MRDHLRFVVAAWVVFVLAGLGGVIAYILTGDTPQEQDHRAQVWGTLLAVVVIVCSSLLWAAGVWASGRSVGLVSVEQRVAAADHLAATALTSWGDQARLQGITTTAPVAVRWQAGPADLAPAGTLGRASSLSEGVVTAWHDELYARLGTDILVVLGDPGSGKSGALLLLLLAALSRRAELPDPHRAATPVPVWVTCGSWNPAETSLTEHVAAVMAQDYPGLTSPAHGGRAGPAALVEHGQLAVFLDGLDEMPAALRPVALEAITRTSRMPIVLTSRTSEYRDATTEGRFRPAAVIELCPVTPDTAAAFLLDRQPPARRAAWQPVLEDLHTRPTSALASVLSTPLGLVLARDTYTHDDPADLLSPGQGNPHDLLAHLLGAFLDHAYPATAHDRRHRKLALYWLSWTARQMGANRDLRWWDLPSCIPRWQLRLIGHFVVGGTVGLAAGVAVGLGLGGGLTSGLSLGLAVGLLVGFGDELGLLLGDGFFVKVLTEVVAAFGGKVVIGPKVPHRLVVRKLTPREFRTALAVGIVLGLPTAGLVGLAIGLVVVLGVSIQLGLMIGLGVALGGGLAYGLMFGLTQAWLTPLDDSPAVTPADSYHAARSSNLVIGPVIGLGVGLVVGLLVGLAAGPAAGAEVGLTVGLLSALAMTLIRGYLPALIATEILLAIRTRRRVRFMPLFQDALNRQVLRQAGMVYQFRHAELQDYLASQHQAG